MIDVPNKTLACDICEKPVTLLIDGRCVNCKPFRACRRCRTGNYESKLLPSWMNRHVCDKCGHKVSK